ncbi:MAG: tRNA (adenosine(37)-N6)-dimethylallyltransferase MiaA [Gammaproteobacteria bacterium]|nr:tRNA (adenosine(37)-N6)-dimethylallyltransferase MiaA [Gammaproteobacteria bacterium]
MNNHSKSNSSAGYLDKHKAVIALMGPTAAGKTALSLELAEALNGEIISVDSALIYRDMDIGTAKPNASELSRVPHHLIDIRDPTESYSAAEFREDCLALIEQIQSRGKTAILVGGTMMYFKALLYGIADLPETDPKVRVQVLQLLEQKGIESLHDYLASFDKLSAQRLHRTDTQRVTRAVEVFLTSGKSLSEWHSEQSLEPFPHLIRQFAIAPQDRKQLHERIERRFDLMFELGFVEEVKRLYERGDLSLELPSMRCVGYRQVWQFCAGEISLDEARYRGIVATRQLAKRQFTWLRSWHDLHWLDTFAENNFNSVLKSLDNISI